MKYYEFFDRIKVWARENNTTLEAIVNNATDKKLSASVYHGWKLRENLPSGEYCYDIAHYMGVSCDWLISGVSPDAEGGKNPSLAEKYRDLLGDLEALDEAGRFAVQQLAHTLASARSAASGTGELAG